MAPAPTTLYIHVLDPNEHQKLHDAKQVMSQYAGADDVILVIGASKTSAVRMPFRVTISPELTTQLQTIFGKEFVVAK